ncbi:hypothetical protein B0H66DRAFT_580395 [Apodospora peruviana]|uniref:Uncharacterized protein n=1 Tax=Apodospora peruviana TaxID=516989 RepID=A0AAE0IH72_9PEZI|nr:hypothetical protein B0H66DRAFT_580395 [Apodospora peruviana]
MFKSQLSQFFSPAPTFSEADVPAQDGKVFIVTGGSSGIGLELCKTLYQKNGQTKESRLHVLWNNAGVSQPPAGSLSKQGIELQLATNCLGPLLFTQFLLPLLKSTAAVATKDASSSVRVIWTSSQMVELPAPQGGIVMFELRTPPVNVTRNYVNSKTGNLLLATETPMTKYLAWPLLHSARLAALTELNGCYVVPWGRIAGSSGDSSTGGDLRKDLVGATKLVEDGGTGHAAEFWGWCVEMTRESQ